MPIGANGNRSLVVFAPSPLLTITAEAAGTQHEEIHLHAGGQGFWAARMAKLLGAEIGFCCALGGESGEVLRALIAKEGVRLFVVKCAASNGVYIHVRRSGVREEVARTGCAGLTRHEADELYGMALSVALDAEVAMLTGVDPPGVLEADLYRRLAADLRGNGVTVVADLTGEPLRAALAGGVDLLKLSDEEAIAEGFAQSSDAEDLTAALDRLHGLGAAAVVISRARQPALFLDGTSGRRLLLAGPQVETLEPRGTGDSMFAALAASLAAGKPLEQALCVGVAAGALNATRRGLGTGALEQIARLSRHVRISELPRAHAERRAESPR